MKETSTTQKTPNILIVEGLWGSGKSSLISYIRKSYPVLFIPEPNYQTAGIKSGISEWYRNQHTERLLLAKTYTEYGEHVVMERSILSSAAFHYAQHGNMPIWFSSVRAELEAITNLNIIFLISDKKTFLKSVSDIRDKSVCSAIKKNQLFYENYIRFFKESDLEVNCIKMTRNYILPKALTSFIKKLFSRRLKGKLKEITERCASAVVIYKDEFLLLYSTTHRQFALPQGHQEKGENLTQTITREIKEESGFVDFKILCQLRTYGFRFYDNGMIIHKLISCYLVKLSTLKINKKKFESHESYRNHFFDHKDVMKKLSWAEDKETMRCAQKILNIH